MVLEVFDISIDNPANNNLFHGGEKLVGSVKINVSDDNSTRAKGVVLKILGIGTTRWTELRTEYQVCFDPTCLLKDPNDIFFNYGYGYVGFYFNFGQLYHKNNSEYNPYKHYHRYVLRVPRTSQHTFFIKEIKLWNGDNSGYFPRGETNFPFTCDLPDWLPSSFYDHDGDISYKVEASIVKPWWYWSNTTETAVFRVVHSLNLNDRPDLLEQKEISAEKSFCCWCCKSGPCSVVLTLPVCGVIRGDILQPTVEVDNSSDTDISNVILKFVRKEKYLYHSSIFENEETIVETQLGSVRADKSKLWDSNELNIPEFHPRHFLKQGLVINTKHYVKVECIPAGLLHEELSVELPVVVGTIPFENLQNHTGLRKRRKIE